MIDFFETSAVKGREFPSFTEGMKVETLEDIARVHRDCHHGSIDYADLAYMYTTTLRHGSYVEWRTDSAGIQLHATIDTPVHSVQGSKEGSPLLFIQTKGANR